MTGVGQAPGLGEGYEQEGGAVLDGVRWGMEWSAGYERRPSQHAQRWSWQNRGGVVDEAEARKVMARTLLADELPTATSAEVSLSAAPEAQVVTRRQLVEALDAWVKSRGASVLGRAYSVSQPRARVAYIDDLIAGPLDAVLTHMGYEVVDGDEATTLGIIS